MKFSYSDRPGTERYLGSSWGTSGIDVDVVGDDNVDDDDGQVSVTLATFRTGAKKSGSDFLLGVLDGGTGKEEGKEDDMLTKSTLPLYDFQIYYPKNFPSRVK